jgi:hypothetical protein
VLLDNGRGRGYTFRLRADYGRRLVVSYCITMLRRAFLPASSSLRSRKRWFDPNYGTIEVSKGGRAFQGWSYHRISAFTMGMGSSPGLCMRLTGKGRRCHSMTNLRASLRSLKEITYLDGLRCSSFFRARYSSLVSLVLSSGSSELSSELSSWSS